MRPGDEVRGAVLGDKRLARRLAAIVEQMADHPDATFPAAMADRAALEATYRFLGNKKVSPEEIVRPHVEATSRRIDGREAVLVAHDTTEFEFGGDKRVDMGWLDGRTNGFLGHFALAVSLDGMRTPLGVIAYETLFRYGASDDRKKRRARRAAVAPASEEQRWWRVVEAAEQQAQGRTSLIHAMDREADSYELLAKFAAHNYRFVIRLSCDRRVLGDSDEPGKLRASVAAVTPTLTREVPLSARIVHRRRASRRGRAPRAYRLASLSFAAARVRIRRGDWAPKTCPPELPVNVVHVFEPSPPKDCEAVEWWLATSEEIDSPEQIEAVVDAYRGRWMVEEYFKALKTGCSFEKRQLGSRHALLNALAVFVPIAWSLLHIRALARDNGDVPATAAFSVRQLRILERHPRSKLRSNATAREALLALARLGGHLMNNGDPGWIVLGRGYETLLVLEEGVALSEM